MSQEQHVSKLRHFSSLLVCVLVCSFSMMPVSLNYVCKELNYVLQMFEKSVIIAGMQLRASRCGEIYSEEQEKINLWVKKLDNQLPHTFRTTSTRAPFPRRRATTSENPPPAALCSGVTPVCVFDTNTGQVVSWCINGLWHQITVLSGWLHELHFI